MAMLFNPEFGSKNESLQYQFHQDHLQDGPHTNPYIGFPGVNSPL